LTSLLGTSTSTLVPIIAVYLTQPDYNMVWSLAVAALNYQFVSVAISPSGNRIAAYTWNWNNANELFYIFNSADGSVYDSKLSYSGSYYHHDFYS
jgi:hypothetical protein